MKTKMSYLQSSRPISRARYYKISTVVLLLVAVIILRGPITSFSFPLLSKLAEPLWGLRNILVSEDIRTRDQAQIMVLEARLRELSSDIDKDYSVAHILSSLAVTPYGTVVIDLGKEDGVTAGDSLVSKEGVALGDVVEVFEGSAKATLYSNYGNSIEVSLADGVRFIMVGSGGQSFEARLPSGMDLEPGDLVYLPGKEYYVLAKIEIVEALPGAAFQRILARSPINIHSITSTYLSHVE